MKINKKNSYLITDPAEKWITSLSKNSLKLPANKFSESLKQRQKQKFQILLSDDNFLDKVKDIRKVFGIPSSGFDNLEECQLWAKKLCSKENIKKSFKNAIKTLYPEKIGPRWYPATEYYIFFNDPNAEHLFPPQLIYGIENNNGKFRLKLEIYKDTTIQDIENIWPDIKKHQKIIGNIGMLKTNKNKGANIIHTLFEDHPIKIKKWDLKRFGAYENFLQYKKAYYLKKEGKTYQEIAVELGWSSADAPKVGTYIKRFKKAIDENTLF